jgi:hypothetical protein
VIVRELTTGGWMEKKKREVHITESLVDAITIFDLSFSLGIF